MVEAELNGAMDVDPIDVSADGGVLKVNRYVLACWH
jgi:hypothetical protein